MKQDGNPSDLPEIQNCDPFHVPLWHERPREEHACRNLRGWWCPCSGSSKCLGNAEKKQDNKKYLDKVWLGNFHQTSFFKKCIYFLNKLGCVFHWPTLQLLMETVISSAVLLLALLFSASKWAPESNPVVSNVTR